MPPNVASLSILMTACGDKEEAAKIARRLVDERLAACVNIFPISSVYRWEEKVQAEDEVLLLIKTRAALTNEARQRIKRWHSYDLPEIVTLNAADCEENYLEWLMKNTRSA